MIDLYLNNTTFIFRHKDKEVGRCPFATLEPVFAKGASKEDMEDVEMLMGEYTLGELLVTKSSKEPILLGPVREFTHEVTLYACGNPDMGQYAAIGPRKTVRVVGLEEAAAAVKAYQSHYEMGGGNCAKEHGVVWELPTKTGGKRKKVGSVGYNGRYETVAETKAFEAEMKAKYGK